MKTTGVLSDQTFRTMFPSTHINRHFGSFLMIFAGPCCNGKPRQVFNSSSRHIVYLTGSTAVISYRAIQLTTTMST